MKASAQKVNTTLPEPDQPPLVTSLEMIPESLQVLVDDLISYLSRSVELQVRDIPFHG